MTSMEKTSEQLRTEWLEHRYFRYRGCAPDPDQPLRMMGNPELHVGAHHGPDAWEPEGQKERRAREDAATEVCLSCPVMVACDAYASSVRSDGKLAEPDGVWGARTSLERHKALIARRVAVPAADDRRFRTPQKQAVLRALAGAWDPFAVAAAAGLGDDVRTANWQRSVLVGLLGLPKDSSRMRVLAVARERGLLEGVTVVADDGTVPAVPPPTRVGSPPAVPEPVPVLVVAVQAEVEKGQSAVERSCRGVRPRRRRVAAVTGQLSFDDALAPAAVTALFPVTSRLEAAA